MCNVRVNMSQGLYSRMVEWSIALLLVWPLCVGAALPEAFDAVHYDIDVTYDVARHIIEGVASCTAVWRGPHLLVDLYFFFRPTR